MGKRSATPTFESRELKDGTGWYVLVSWGDWPSEQTAGFRTQEETEEWIKHSAAAWLKERRDGAP